VHEGVICLPRADQRAGHVGIDVRVLPYDVHAVDVPRVRDVGHDDLEVAKLSGDLVHHHRVSVPQRRVRERRRALMKDDRQPKLLRLAVDPEGVF